jgi:hypothetical protein
MIDRDDNERRFYPMKNANPVPMSDLVKEVKKLEAIHSHGGKRKGAGKKKNANK